MQYSRHRVETLFSVFLKAFLDHKHKPQDELVRAVTDALAPYNITPAPPRTSGRDTR